MSSDDPQTNASWPPEELAPSKQGRPLTRGMHPVILRRERASQRETV